MHKIFLLIFFIISCSSDSNVDVDNIDPPPVKIIPSNLVFNVEIAGIKDEEPYGDGSGVVKFTASATDAVNYSFRFGTGEVQDSSSGSVEYTYTEFGTKSYTVNVLAYSTSGDFISSAKTIVVYVEATSDDDILKILTGGNEKTWKIQGKSLLR